jgi:hypothetical protein
VTVKPTRHNQPPAYFLVEYKKGAVRQPIAGILAESVILNKEVLKIMTKKIIWFCLVVFVLGGFSQSLMYG